MTPGDSIRDKLLEKFRGITVERITRLNNIFVALEKNPQDAPLVQQVLREIHTLKGEAKMMGQNEINTVAHHIEDLLLLARQRDFAVPAALSRLIYAGFDLIGNLLQGDHSKAAERWVIDAVGLSKALPTEVAAAVPSVPAALMGPPPVASVRVDMRKLDRLTDLTGDMILTQGYLQSQVHAVQASLVQLRRVLRSTRNDPAAAIDAVMGACSPLQDHVFSHHMLLAALEERVRDLRLVPLSSLFNQFPRAMRDLATEQHKQVRLHVRGSDVAIDGDVLDHIGEPLLHLLRNAVDHGIELPNLRVKAGKPPEGNITLSATQRGSLIEIEVSDDGAGLDPVRLREAAVKNQVVTEAQSNMMTREELLALIFRPGFSTRTEITDISGRGVGLDVVRAQLQGLSGTVDMRTALNEGTTFNLTVPVSMTMGRALVMQVGEGYYAVPSESVHIAMMARTDQFVTVAHGSAIRLGDTPVAVSQLHAVLGLPEIPSRPGPQAVLVLEQRGLRRAFIVSRFVGERQVVQRRLDPFFASLPLISGTAVLADGELALMLQVAEVMHASGEAGFWHVARAERKDSRSRVKPLVLVVDDSEVTRDMVVGLLQARGYRVAEAVNGADALRRAQSLVPDLILTDLEMPLVDGLTLLSNIRRNPQLRTIPVIVFSTRGSDQDKQHAFDRGANAYLVKTTFREEELYAALHQLMPQ